MSWNWEARKRKGSSDLAIFGGFVLVALVLVGLFWMAGGGKTQGMAQLPTDTSPGYSTVTMGVNCQGQSNRSVDYLDNKFVVLTTDSGSPWSYTSQCTGGASRTDVSVTVPINRAFKLIALGNATFTGGETAINVGTIPVTASIPVDKLPNVGLVGFIYDKTGATNITTGYESASYIYNPVSTTQTIGASTFVSYVDITDNVTDTAIGDAGQPLIFGVYSVTPSNVDPNGVTISSTNGGFPLTDMTALGGCPSDVVKNLKVQKCYKAVAPFSWKNGVVRLQVVIQAQNDPGASDDVYIYVVPQTHAQNTDGSYGIMSYDNAGNLKSRLMTIQYDLA
jgi:hypothetical protein